MRLILISTNDAGDEQGTCRAWLDELCPDLDADDVGELGA